MSSKKRIDPGLKALLDSVGSAAAVLAIPGRLGREGAGPAAVPAGPSWLASAATLFVFRTRNGATFACEQALERGYPATYYDHYAVIEAPWLFISALAARLGVGSEVLGIHWESNPPPLPTLRLLG